MQETTSKESVTNVDLFLKFLGEIKWRALMRIGTMNDISELNGTGYLDLVVMVSMASALPWKLIMQINSPMSILHTDRGGAPTYSSEISKNKILCVKVYILRGGPVDSRHLKNISTREDFLFCFGNENIC